ncbi:putative Adenylate kinase 8 [Hypsibius exemplaris]|uniref:Adenylate kinase 8 n=1 Tax=Hypsibius exemplaris TaxID=2072580 RepID=A0A1W0WQX1_HYPEX|nr:putative Adenylate kinase 8 [Hypsibius exemplaris]
MQELVATRPIDPIPALVRYFLRQSPSIVRVTVTGPPFSGRHVLARKIADTYDLPFIEPDALMASSEPQIRALVKQYRKKRRALPPGLAFTLLRQKIFSDECVEKGWVLCGFPETRAQDDLLRRRLICAQKTIILNVSPDTAAKRCGDSRVDPRTKLVYNVNENLPTDSEILARLIAPPCEASEGAAEVARNFAYESMVLQKSLENLSCEDPCCIALDGDRPFASILSEVPDDMVASMVLDQLKGSELQGYILRGFPRSRVQAHLLAQFGLQPSKVFFFNLAEDAATARLISRGKELHQKAQTLEDLYVPHERPDGTRFFKGIVPGFCDEDIQRAVIQDQNLLFSHNEPQLRDLYKHELYDIDASLPEADVFGQIKYHLLHPRPIKPVDKPGPANDKAFDSLASETSAETSSA